MGGDLREGKATYPVLCLLGGPHDAEVRAILERRAGEDGDVARMIALARQERTDDCTREEIRRRARLAIAALDALPPSPARTALAALAERELNRTH